MHWSWSHWRAAAGASKEKVERMQGRERVRQGRVGVGEEKLLVTCQ